MSGPTRAESRRGHAHDARPAGLSPDAVRTYELSKHYRRGRHEVRALDDVTVGIQRARLTGIMGPSGSGKSTLLHCLAGLDTPTSGQVMLGDTDLTRLSERKLTRLRRDRIGVIFQSYNLLPQLTVRQNVVLPVEVAGRRVDRAWLDMVLDVLDLGPLLPRRPEQLSGGQQQRVAVARALLPRPDVVFADEPTGALDSATSREMLRFLRVSVEQLGQTVVMVTHDPFVAEYTDRLLLLDGGRLVGQILDPTAHMVLDVLADLQGHLAERSRAERARTGQWRPDRPRADRPRIEQSRIEQLRTEQSRANRSQSGRHSIPAPRASRHG